MIYLHHCQGKLRLPGSSVAGVQRSFPKTDCYQGLTTMGYGRRSAMVNVFRQSQSEQVRRRKWGPQGQVTTTNPTNINIIRLLPGLGSPHTPPLGCALDGTRAMDVTCWAANLPGFLTHSARLPTTEAPTSPTGTTPSGAELSSPRR